MRSIKKSKTFLVLFLILSLTTVSLAQPGKYVQLEKDQKIPWNGWCFDGQAMAQLVAEREMAEQKCELYTLQELEHQRAKFDLEIGQLHASMDYEIQTRETTIQALKKENLKLEEAIIHNNKFGWIGPATIGLIVGALSALIVVI